MTGTCVLCQYWNKGFIQSSKLALSVGLVSLLMKFMQIIYNSATNKIWRRLYFPCLHLGVAIYWTAFQMTEIRNLHRTHLFIFGYVPNCLDTGRKQMCISSIKKVHWYPDFSLLVSLKENIFNFLVANSKLIRQWQQPKKGNVVWFLDPSMSYMWGTRPTGHG